MLRFSGKKSLFHSIKLHITSPKGKNKKEKENKLYGTCLLYLLLQKTTKRYFYSFKYINSNMCSDTLSGNFGRKKKGKKEFLTAYALGFVHYFELCRT